MEFAIIIPAQENNKYHKFGDLAPFGDTTLLEWKIAQCKDFANNSQIYINSDSKQIEKIAKKEGIEFILRHSNLDYQNALIESIEDIDAKSIMCVNTTSPFLDSNIYMSMYKQYIKENLMSLISVEKKEEYVFFKGEKLNFQDDFISRKDIEPIYTITHGCHIFNKKRVVESRKIIASKLNYFELDSFTSTEIKDMIDYTIAKELISIYFRKGFDE